MRLTNVTVFFHRPLASLKRNGNEKPALSLIFHAWQLATQADIGVLTAN
jgi:hypothetical protein